MSDHVTRITERYEKGLVILAQLFELKKPELLDKLKSVCGSKVPDHVFDDNPTVRKTSEDDVPKSIEVYCYDGIIVSPFGINYKPEHGVSTEIVEFNNHFVL